MSSRRWWPGPGRRRADQSGAAATFGALGLAADPALTDDEVRMAWRRVAAATHPDRADGGDPAAFAAAAAAYSLLRTTSGRGEVMADAAGGPAGGAGPAPEPGARPWALRWAARPGTLRWIAGHTAGLAWRVSHGRPWRLAGRAAAALALCVAVLAVTGSRPAGPALVTGVLTWLAMTARRDLAAAPAHPQPGQTDPGRS